MNNKIQVTLEYYGSVSSYCKRECDYVNIDIKHQSAEEQIREFIYKRYPTLSSYSLLLDGYICSDDYLSLQNGSRIKVFPWCIWRGDQ